MDDTEHLPSCTIAVVTSDDASRVGYRCTVDRPIVVGRNPDCDLQVRDSSLSRRHVQLFPAHGGLRLVDLGSANGVFVGPDRVFDVVVSPGQRFRVGRTVFECSRAPGSAAADVSETGDGTLLLGPHTPWTQGPHTLEMPASAPSPPPPAPPSLRLEEAGDAIEPGDVRPVLLSGVNGVFYVVAGSLSIFGVALSDGVPTGSRTHVVDVPAGGLAFAMDLGPMASAWGLQAVPQRGTTLRAWSRGDLERLASEVPELLASRIDRWIAALSACVHPRSRPDSVLPLHAHVDADLPAGTAACAETGVIWAEVRSGDVIANGRGLVIVEGTRAPFPLTAATWISPNESVTAPIRLSTRTTRDVLDDAGFFRGLDSFHALIGESLFVERVVALVDEFDRLAEKARIADEAEAAGYDAIGSVLRDETMPPLPSAGVAAEVVLDACRIIGDAAGFNVRPHPYLTAIPGYDERLRAIASVSGFRTRRVLLRGNWWWSDHGPLLCQQADTKGPVVALPRAPGSYVAIDPGTRARRAVTPAVASTFAPFAYSVYRPFPPGTPRVRDLVVFGLRGVRRDCWMAAIMAVLIGLFGTVTPYFTGQLFSTAIPQADRGMLIGFAAALVLAAASSSIFEFVKGVAAVRIQARMGSSIQSAVWDRLLNLPVGFFRAYESGDLADRAGGVEQIQSLVASGGVSAILGAFSGLFYVAQMFVYSVSLALAAIGLTAIFVGTTMLCNLLQLRLQRVETTMRGRLAALVLNLISGVSKLRTSGAERHAFRLWAGQYAEQRRISYRAGRIQDAAITFSATFPLLSTMVVFMVFETQERGDWARGPQLTAGDFIAFNAAFALFLMAMHALGESSLTLLHIVPLYERLRPILDAEPETDSSKGVPHRLRGEIVLSHVSFRYDEDGPLVIDDLSIRIAPGEFVALVGESGCGKSTLMRLMLGFERPLRGTVSYDGQDLAALDLRLLRQQLGVVLQASRVMPAELYKNIIGATAHTLADAWRAAEAAGLADDIREMPMGMHTYVSEGGGTLSGGQRQRLMIARAIVNAPRILFLDEATSALDNLAQAVVTESLDRMEATRVVIAHRLSTIVHASRICYLEGGRIVEMGTYEELIHRNGRFAALARRQTA